MIAPIGGGKTYLQEQMLRELGERHRGKVPVVLLATKPDDHRLV